MVDIENVQEKLRKVYKEICENDGIYTKFEAIELFEKYNFDDEDIEILPLSDLDDESDTLKYIDETEDISFFYSDNVINEIMEYADNTEFVIDLPSDFNDSLLAYRFKNKIFSNTFTSEELIYILEILMKGIIKYRNHSQINTTDEIKEYVKKFDGAYSLNDFIYKYANDNDFCRFILDIYTMIYFEDKFNEEHNKSEVLTINDLIRKIFSQIHNKNLCLGYSNNYSFSIILHYLTNMFPAQYINNLYYKELNGFKIEDICNTQYIKIIMITDYLKSCGQKYLDFEEMDDVDTEYINYISNNNIYEIIKRFNNDRDFAHNIINEFIELNLYCDNKLYENTTYIKQIKRLNPLYKLDYMKKDI